jgi:LSD1 subclass zinc finger protein
MSFGPASDATASSLNAPALVACLVCQPRSGKMGRERVTASHSAVRVWPPDYPASAGEAGRAVSEPRHPDSDVDLYTCCPECGFIAPAESVDRALILGGGSDWDAPVSVTCLVCQACHQVTARDVLPASAHVTCRGCGTLTSYPAGAARIRCTGCGVYLVGPSLTGAQREKLRTAQGRAGAAVREAHLRERRRSGKKPPGK